VADVANLTATAAASDEGEALWGLGGLLLVKIPAASTGGRFAVLEERVTRGVASPAHVHPEDEETFIVLAGELSLWIEGERIEGRPGSVVYVPPGLVHAWRVESDEARTLVVTTAQHERFYRACSTPAPAAVQPPMAGQVDLSVIGPAAESHGVHLLGPPWTEEEPAIVKDWRPGTA
jgi:quercetin dioxygenase-like cupin family protein